jgi:hypothetical protein
VEESVPQNKIKNILGDWRKKAKGKLCCGVSRAVGLTRQSRLQQK